MSAQNSVTVDELSPPDAHAALTADPSSILVDVRTRAEWTFTGMPDLSALGKDVLAVEWVSFPSMAPNQGFYDEVLAKAGGTLPGRLFFICRSGARSLAAARAVAAESAARGHPVHCTNVAEGFEGDLDERHHRGNRGGWKLHGLPWRQN
jgi:rhodanese-related sulfurtransferase